MIIMALKLIKNALKQFVWMDGKQESKCQRKVEHEIARLRRWISNSCVRLPLRSLKFCYSCEIASFPFQLCWMKLED